MRALSRPTPTAPATEVWRRRGRLLVHGGVLAALGAVTLLLAGASPFFTVGVLAPLLVLGGAAEVAHAFRFWRNHWAGFVPALVAGVLDLVCGVLLQAGGTLPVVGITLLMVAVLVARGALWLLWSLRGAPGRRVAAAHGVVSLLLAIGLWVVWPVASLSPVGLFVGGDLLASGASLLFLAHAVRRFAPRGA